MTAGRRDQATRASGVLYGSMLWFNEAKDVGLIAADDGERLLVRGSGFAGGKRPRGRCGGLIIAFRVNGEEGAAQAEDVVFLPEDAPRRARLRPGRRGMRAQ